MASPPALQAQVQEALGDAYLIERELAGGMARVFLGHDRALDRRIVVKVFVPGFAAGVSAERFRREVLVSARLQHPHVIPVLSAGESRGILFYTMPFVDGETLGDYLLRHGPLTIEQAISIAREVAGALEYAHQKGVVHRDVKPANILMSGGHAMLADFGIAHALGSDGNDAVTQAGLTEPGVVMGTPAYMSPEQVAGERQVDARSDLYALACVLYEMLAGQPPFTGATRAVVMSRHVLDRVPPLTSARRDCPAQIADAVLRALAKRPADRFATVAGFVAALEAPAPDRQDHSIVVLPFANLSPDPENAFFADGLTEEVITDLSRIRALRVISRHSSVQLKGTDKDTRTIGRELDVRYVLEGSVRRAGQSLRVTSQLVEAESDTQLWAERFTGTTADIFEIQEQIARKISDALAVRLTSAEERRLTRQPFRDMQAFEWYLRARQLNLAFTAPAIGDGLVLVEKAIEREGEHAGLLALKGYLLWNRHQIESSDMADLTKATRCVERALALDPDLSTALIARALLETRKTVVDSGLILRLLHRAYVTEPTTDACCWLTIFLCQTGRPERSVSIAKDAARIDPLSGPAALVPCFSNAFMGLRDETLTISRQALARHQNEAMLRFFSGQLAATMGAFDEAATTLGAMTPTGWWGTLAALYRDGLAGQVGNIQRLVADGGLRDLALMDDQLCWTLAQVLTGAGAHDEAMWWLRHGAERGFVNARFVREVDQTLAPLRGHPDMSDLLVYMDGRAEEIAHAVDADLGTGLLPSTNS